jgi:uncharacterized protein YcbX
MTPTLYFPIDACAGIDNPDAAPYDRQWLVVDADGRWLTQRDHPSLAQVAVAIRFGYLVIRAPGMLRMDIPLDVIEDDESVWRHATIGKQRVDVVDEGDLAAAWISNFLGVPSRLVKVHPDVPAVMWPE